MRTLAVVLLGLGMWGASCARDAGVLTGTAALQAKAQADHDLAVARARELYAQAVVDGRDLSKGPCLTDSAVPDWVVDIVHHPRIPADDDPENQCRSYVVGTTHHFVELDPTGQLIRAE